MSGELDLAAERLTARKEAHCGELTGGLSDGDGALACLSGFDLAPDEVDRYVNIARRMFIQAALESGKPGVVGGALWMEGLAMGLLIAEARERGDV